MDHMKSNDLFYSKQGGFRRNHSTIKTINYLLDFINLNRNSGKFIVTVYIDLKKAFNTVNHSILIQKMIKLGFNNNFVSLLFNYLNERKQSVKETRY